MYVEAGEGVVSYGHIVGEVLNFFQELVAVEDNFSLKTDFVFVKKLTLPVGRGGLIWSWSEVSDPDG